MGTKKCKKCGETKLICEFDLYYDKRSGQVCNQSYCRSCRSEISRLQGTGCTPEQYKKLFQNQNGVCAICSQPEKIQQLSADHCHATKKTRGLLCHHCNHGLGNFKDSPELLRKAANYLEKEKEKEKEKENSP